MALLVRADDIDDALMAGPIDQLRPTQDEPRSLGWLGLLGLLGFLGLTTSPWFFAFFAFATFFRFFLPPRR